MVHLVPMTEAEFTPYRARLMQDYAQEHVKAGNWHPSEALQRAEKEFRHLLPDGLATKNQYLFSIQDEATGLKVGMIWFAVDDTRPQPSAFIFDFVIQPEFRRRGFGLQTLQVLEEKVKELGVHGISLRVFGHDKAARALYEKAGYEVTDLLWQRRWGKCENAAACAVRNMATRRVSAVCAYRLFRCHAKAPPSATRLCPVTYEAASEQSHKTTLAISSGLPNLPIAVRVIR